MEMNGTKPILLVEDDEIDVMTVKRALRDIENQNSLVVTENGEEALEYLMDARNEKPFIILLDLNMPRMNGIEFLRVAKQTDAIKSIPVIVLTTSREQQDVIESYNLGVGGYMIKPVNYRQFVDALRTINMYWNLCWLPE